MAKIIPLAEKILSNHLPGKEKVSIYRHGETFTRHFYSVKIGNTLRQYKPYTTLKQIIGYLTRMGY